jgi:hypothetical protein
VSSVELTDGRGRGRKWGEGEPNHTTTRNPGPL